MAGMEPSMDEVQQEMQNVVLAGPVKERADRTMRAIREKNPTILASPENLKLTAALQSLGVQRINGDVFGAWSEKLKHEESVEHPIYIQLKDNQPDLDKNPVVRKWMYEPSQIDGRIDKDKYWFVDMGVGDQGLLGFGARIWRSKVSVTSKAAGAQPLALGCGASGPTGPLPVDPVVPEAEKRPPANISPTAIGDVLVLNSKMNKDKYDNKRATVLNVLSNGAVLKVELMEGPVKGEIVKRPVENFTIPAEKAAPRTLGEDVGDKATGKDDLVLKHFGEAVRNMCTF